MTTNTEFNILEKACTECKRLLGETDNDEFNKFQADGKCPFGASGEGVLLRSGQTISDVMIEDCEGDKFEESTMTFITNEKGSNRLIKYTIRSIDVIGFWKSI